MKAVKLQNWLSSKNLGSISLATQCPVDHYIGKVLPICGGVKAIKMGKMGKTEKICDFIGK